MPPRRASGSNAMSTRRISSCDRWTYRRPIASSPSTMISCDASGKLAAYERCVEGTTYPQRDWVKSNHKEFFAGVTTRYFGRKEEREAVGKRDPVLEEFLQKTWSKPNATLDTPWKGPRAIK